MSEIQYYNIVEQTRYSMKIEPVKNIAECSDDFLTKEELIERFEARYVSDYTRSFTDHALVRAELNKIVDPLEDGKIRSVVIEDEDLLAVVKEHGMSRYVAEVRRRGNRISRWSYRPRKQKAPRKSDGRAVWSALTQYMHSVTGHWPPHFEVCTRTPAMLTFYQRAVRWKHIVKFIPESQKRWARMVWQKPEEYL